MTIWCGPAIISELRWLINCETLCTRVCDVMRACAHHLMGLAQHVHAVLSLRGNPGIIYEH